MLTNPFILTNRRVELYIDKNRSNASWGRYRGRCNTDKLDNKGRSVTDLGVEGFALDADVFLDIDEVVAGKFKGNDKSSFRVNSFLGTIGVWIEEEEIELLS